MLTILSIFGTRPEAIKMAPVIKLLKQTRGVRSLTAVTAQHREMMDQVLSRFNIVPDYDLNLMQPRQSLTDITCRTLRGLESVLTATMPDLVLVHGDTTTTFAASLASFYQQLPVGHVEAGLRTNCKYNPFPEEVNRRLVATLADLHFAPTARARDNLLQEGISNHKIYVTGNTALDTLRYTVKPGYIFPDRRLNNIDFNRPVLLAEVHRRENWGKPLENICLGLRRLVDKHGVTLIFPVHRNPRVKKTVNRILNDHPGIILLEPLDIVTFHNLLTRCYLVLTDSGGIQEEAPSLGCPVLLLRETTERPEVVETGAVKIVGTAEQNIYQETRFLLCNRQAYQTMAKAANPYGDGYAAYRIRAAILYYFKRQKERPADFWPSGRTAIPGGKGW